MECEERDRQRAIERYLADESPTTICNSLGRSRFWFYKWLKRYKKAGEGWYRDRSRRPLQNPNCTPCQIEEIVKLERLRLYNQGLFCGPQAIRWQLEEMAVRPLPSERTIARILARNELTHRRTGRYQPKGKKYPQRLVQKPGEMHQSDYVGPCYLKGQSVIRFYSLNSVDVATGRCAVEPVLNRAGQSTIGAFWASWLRLGMPRYQQVDNEAVFYGSPTHPRGMGKAIRLCLLYGIEPCFVPLGEPWRNGVVEKFNHHFHQKFLDRVPMHSVMDMRRESLSFEQRHNGRYRYSKLRGKTPLQSLAASQIILRFPPSAKPPCNPLPKPECGKYHVFRFIRSDGLLDLFGEKFVLPPETVYEYIRATVDVAQQKLFVYLDNALIDMKPYRLRP